MAKETMKSGGAQGVAEKAVRAVKAKRTKPPAFLERKYGVANWKQAEEWLAWRSIEDLECITPDLAGVPRGKMMPSNKFTSQTSLALPSALFRQTISGEYPEETGDFRYDPHDGDLKLMPDLSTLSAVPWESDPTAQVICDLVGADGKDIGYTPRAVLKKVVAAYEKKGWKPVVAPEIEFYLVARNTDPDYQLQPPVGRSGRPIAGGQAYSIAGVNEFDDLIDDIYHFCEGQGLEIDTLIHEEGPSQLEINLRHGDPVALADQVFLMKRTIREAALKQTCSRPSWPSPCRARPAMRCISTSRWWTCEDRQEHLLRARRLGDGAVPLLHRRHAALHSQGAGDDGALCELLPPADAGNGGAGEHRLGLRQPHHRLPHPDLRARPARRVENRLPSSDANPYLALAASLACGYLGMVNGHRADQPDGGDGQRRRDLAAARPAGSGVADGGGTRFRRCAGPRIHRDACRRQARRVRDLHARDQPVGTRVPASQRLKTRP
jgi:glutamine synthetase